MMLQVPQLLVVLYTTPTQTQSETTTMVFDFQRPVHCSSSSACIDNWLDVGDPYTTDVSIKTSMIYIYIYICILLVGTTPNTT